MRSQYPYPLSYQRLSQRSRFWRVFLLPGEHLGDFFLLRGDDAAGEAAQFRVFAVL